MKLKYSFLLLLLIVISGTTQAQYFVENSVIGIKGGPLISKYRGSNWKLEETGKNITKTRLGSSYALFMTTPLSSSTYGYVDMVYASRPSGIEFSSSENQTDGDGEVISTVKQEVKGEHKLQYLGFSAMIGKMLHKNVSVYGGLGIDLRTYAYREFTSKKIREFVDPERESIEAVQTYSDNGTDAIDILDFRLDIGVRGHLNFATASLGYSRDLFGINVSSETGISNTFINQGPYFSIEIPLRK